MNLWGAHYIFFSNSVSTSLYAYIQTKANQNPQNPKPHFLNKSYGGCRLSKRIWDRCMWASVGIVSTGRVKWSSSSRTVVRLSYSILVFLFFSGNQGTPFFARSFFVFEVVWGSQHSCVRRVLDCKLYVFDGFSSELSENCGWMEVYDPISDTWESLPSPPLPVPPFSVRMYAALESKQQIVVALHCDPKSRNFSTLFIYNISNRCWTKLAHHFGVHPGYPFRIYRTPVAVGNTLYWVSVYFHRGYNDIRIHAHAYDLDRDEWLVGSLNIFCRGVKSPILLEDELLVDKAHTPPLLHLADQKFCIFLHSTNRKHTFHHNKEGIKHDYLNCLILEISPPIFDHDKDKDKDKDNSTDPDHSSILCISIVSVHKFPFHDKLSFHDSSLL